MNPDTRIRRILAAVDFSPMASSVVLPWAVQEAQQYAAQLTLFHVFSPQLMNLQVPEELLPSSLELISRMRTLAEGEMTQLQEQAQRLGASQVAIQLEDSGQRIGRCICDYAHNQHFDLIVLGNHSQGLVGRLLLGSVASDVIQHAHCPVLVLRETAPSNLTPQH